MFETAIIRQTLNLLYHLLMLTISSTRVTNYRLLFHMLIKIKCVVHQNERPVIYGVCKKRPQQFKMLKYTHKYLMLKNIKQNT